MEISYYPHAFCSWTLLVQFSVRFFKLKLIIILIVRLIVHSLALSQNLRALRSRTVLYVQGSFIYPYSSLISDAIHDGNSKTDEPLSKPDAVTLSGGIEG